MSLCSACFRKKAASQPERTGHAEKGSDGEILGIEDVMLYSYKELQIATQNFSPASKIGIGGFGSVYKGRLKDGRLVAIKVLSEESKQGLREFLTEMIVISTINHDNLVKLYGCCVEGTNRILVYGYLENSSLDRRLLGGCNNNIQFSWENRVKICIGIARGLAFLHEEFHPHIVHRDIKASNILLDKDLTPKISDFGLAKLLPSSVTHISTRVAGTLGYLAPEYAMKGQLTKKADIYSFGVLLLEIVSGRNNINKQLPAGEQYLLERAWRLHESGELIRMVDESLDGNFKAEEAFKYLKIALMCTQDMPKRRPAMSTVAKMLMGQKGVDDHSISKPGLISDFMDLKIKKDKESYPSSSAATFSGDMPTTSISYPTTNFTSSNEQQSS